jgi:neutral ceramidase
MVGCAVTDITPAIGLPMGGYELRKGVARGIARPLLGKFVLFRDPVSHTSAAIVVLDLERLGFVASQFIKARLESMGLPSESVLILSTHTHSSPQYNLENEKLRTYFMHTLPSLIGEMFLVAENSLKPSLISHATARITGVGAHRHNGCDSLSLMDLLVFHDINSQENAPFLIVAGYACHPTVLDASNLLYSPDFVGFFREELASAISVPTVVFMNGAAGDISTRFTRREQSELECRRFGSILADQAKKALEMTEEIGTSPIVFRIAEFSLRTRTLPSNVEADLLVEKTLSEYQRAVNNCENEVVVRRLLTTWQGAVILARYASQGLPKSIRSNIQGIRVGDVVFLGIPGELYSSGGYLIKQRVCRSVDESNVRVIVCGYANDYLGYFIDSDSDHEYETLSTPFRPDGCEQLVEEVTQLAKELLR